MRGRRRQAPNGWAPAQANFRATEVKARRAGRSQNPAILDQLSENN